MRSLLFVGVLVLISACGKLPEQATDALPSVSEVVSILPVPAPSAAPLSGDDDFMASSINPSMWEILNLVTGSLDQGSGFVTFNESNAGYVEPSMRTKYHITSPTFKVSVKAHLTSNTINTKIFFRLLFGTNSIYGYNSISWANTVNYFGNPVLQTVFHPDGNLAQPFNHPTVTSRTATISIERTATELVFMYDDGTGPQVHGTVLLSTLPAAYSGNFVRVEFGFGNHSSGTMQSSVSEFNTNGASIEY